MNMSAEPVGASVPDLPTEFLLSRLSQLEALASPMRVRVLKHATDPVAVGELAERLNVPKTRLYYHVNLLVEEGLLVQVDQRKAGARIEKIYRTAGSRMQPGPGLLESVDEPRKAAEIATAVVLEPARIETEAILEQRFAGGERVIAEIGRSHARLTEDQAESFQRKVLALLDEFTHDDAALDTEGREYSFTFTFVPTDPGEDR